MCFSDNKKNITFFIFIMFLNILSLNSFAANEEVEPFLTKAACEQAALQRSKELSPVAGAPYLVDNCSVSPVSRVGYRFYPSKKDLKKYACAPALLGWNLYVSEYFVANYSQVTRKFNKGTSLETCISRPFLHSRNYSLNTYCSGTRLIEKLETLAPSSVTVLDNFDFDVTSSIEKITRYTTPTPGNCSNSVQGSSTTNGTEGIIEVWMTDPPPVPPILPAPEAAPEV